MQVRCDKNWLNKKLVGSLQSKLIIGFAFNCVETDSLIILEPLLGRI